MIAKIIPFISKKLTALTGPVLAKIALAVIAGWLATVAALGVQTWKLDKAHKQKDRAEVLLDVCKSANSGLVERLEAQKAQAEANIKRLEAQIAKGEQVAQDAVAEKEGLINDLQDQIERINNAADGDECAAVQPYDVNRVLQSSDY